MPAKVLLSRIGLGVRFVLQAGKVINPRRIKTNGVPPYRETILYVKRGLLVFNRVTSAGVFSPEVVATARPLRVPSLTVSLADQVLIDRELKELGGTPATVLYSELKQAAIGDGSWSNQIGSANANEQ